LLKVEAGFGDPFSWFFLMIDMPISVLPEPVGDARMIFRAPAAISERIDEIAPSW
jgi:hypothetical protein